jgi:hypothetical protein
MKLVAHQLTIWRVLGQVQLIGEHHQDSLDHDIIGELHPQALVAGGVPHLKMNIPHRASYRLHVTWRLLAETTGRKRFFDDAVRIRSCVSSRRWRHRVTRSSGAVVMMGAT